MNDNDLLRVRLFVHKNNAHYGPPSIGSHLKTVFSIRNTLKNKVTDPICFSMQNLGVFGHASKLEQ